MKQENGRLRILSISKKVNFADAWTYYAFFRSTFFSWFESVVEQQGKSSDIQ